MELPPAGRRGSFLLVAVLLLIAVLLEQYWLVRLFPWLSDFGGVQPMIVFLDIPLRLPVIDWIPVGVLFLFLYLVVISPVTSLARKGWSVFTGWWLMLICLASGGGLYYLLEDQLPKQVRNGIDSFGIRADISVPWPGEGIIHLHGGMIMLITFLIGGRFFLRCTRLPQPAFIPAPGLAQPRTTSQPPGASSQSPGAAAQPPGAVTQPPGAVAQPVRPRIPLPAGPTPVMVRPCVVKGVLEPS